MENQKYSVYIAGPMFQYSDILANERIEKELNKFELNAVLPQKINVENFTCKQIRDIDFENIVRCDFILCNFSGQEVDSGTVAEFMFAKALDIPCVIYVSGHNRHPNEPFNLMMMNYPRTYVFSEPPFKYNGNIDLIYSNMCKVFKYSLFDTLNQDKCLFDNYFNVYKNAFKSVDFNNIDDEQLKIILIDKKNKGLINNV